VLLKIIVACVQHIVAVAYAVSVTWYVSVVIFPVSHKSLCMHVVLYPWTS